MSRLPLRWLPFGLASVLALGGLSACAEVIGIEDAELDPCETYCSTVMTNCTGDLQQFASMQTCSAICLQWQLGTPGVTNQNDVRCRLFQAEQAGATGEPQNHCPNAGPAGDACGGDECANFCELFNAICPLQVSQTHEDVLRCQTDCAAFGEADMGVFSASIVDGDTLQCRWYHLSAAALDPATHCAHVAGEAECVDVGSGGAGAGGGTGGTGGVGGAGGG